MAVDSKTFRVFISSDGTSTGVKTLVEGLKDVTVNTGRSAERSVGKATTSSYVTDNGFSVDFAMDEERPLGVAQALLWTASDAGATVYAWIEDTVTGGLSFAGDFLAVISQIDSPAEGLNSHSVTLSISGNVTRGVVPAPGP